MGTLNNPVNRKMGLAEEAQRVAAEFEYSAQDVNKGVKAFIQQMGTFCCPQTRHHGID